jgi:hypothetical protein
LILVAVGERDERVAQIIDHDGAAADLDQLALAGALPQ